MKFTASIAICATALFTSQSNAQALLGAFSAGQNLEVMLDQPITATFLTVFLDGEALDPNMWSLAGTTLIIQIPDTLTGQRHDLELRWVGPSETRSIGSWIFDTPISTNEALATVVTELGVAASDTRSDTYSSASGRLDYMYGGGRFAAGLSFAHPDSAGADSPPALMVNDLFVESMRPLFGDDLFIRAGFHNVASDSYLMDEETRRGISFRLQDLSDRYQVALFSLSPNAQDGDQNLTGLEDRDDIIHGTYGYFHPFQGASARLSFVGYTGNSILTPDAVPGTGEAMAVMLSGPLGTRGHMDYALGYEETSWQTTGPANTGRAITAEWDIEAFADDERNLALAFDYFQVDQSYYSFLNPNRVVGVQGGRAELGYYTREWQFELGIGQKETNFNGSTTSATDQINELSTSLFYLPQDFTGGFLRNATFYALLDILDQRRLISPAGAPDPQDFTFYSGVIGFEKFRNDYSVAVSYQHDYLDDRTAADADERAQSIELLFAYNPTTEATLKVNLEVGILETDTFRYRHGLAGVALRQDIIPDRLASETAFGFADYEDPGVTDGRFFRQSLEWGVSENHTIVFSADYGKGDYVHDLVDSTEGWTIGIALRSEFSHTMLR